MAVTPSISRIEFLHERFPKAPSFRFRQLEEALFQPGNASYADISNLPKDMRESLEQNVSWMSVSLHQLYESKRGDTFKAILKAADGKEFESVLMQNKRGYWTICVSSQVGCAMACSFCATGTMGFDRNLSADEIIDQYRFWSEFLYSRPQLAQRISNVVFMGMGEPLANYEAVKRAIHTWLAYTDMGPTKITVSTVGVLNQMQKLLDDPEWPDVRIAISLHSASEHVREGIIRTTVPHFHDRLKRWCWDYAKKRGNRKHYLTFEYILLAGVNDSVEDARLLAEYTKECQVKKINVIPYNRVAGKVYSKSQSDSIEAFKEMVRAYDVDVTQRKTMGDDIAAACGQLVTLGKRTKS